MISRLCPWTALLAFLLLLGVIKSTIQADQTPATKGVCFRCPEVFPKKPWESVHHIEAYLAGNNLASFLGVTRGDPAQGGLHSLLLTPEGFTLFEGELLPDGLVIRVSVPPFDSAAFASGLMADVKTLFLSPPGKPRVEGNAGEVAGSCYWEGPEGRTEIRGSADDGWEIRQRDDRGQILREISLAGPFVQGLAAHLTLRVLKPAPYLLKMTLIQAGP
jgi:hypothetical protein